MIKYVAPFADYNNRSYYISDTKPPNPMTGDVWYNSATTKIYVFYDSFWVQI